MTRRLFVPVMQMHYGRLNRIQSHKGFRLAKARASCVGKLADAKEQAGLAASSLNPGRADSAGRASIVV